MWRNYLTVGIRSLGKNKTYAFINVFGLALGLAACLMILLYVRHELSYDRWLPGAERVYQLQSEMAQGATEEKMLLQMAPYPAGIALKKDFPQVEKLVHAQFGSPVIIRNGEAKSGQGLLYVDGPVFDILQLPLVRGDPAALERVGSIVLTEEATTEFFGSTDPIGKVLTLKEGDKSSEYRVTGILKDLPKNSHLSFKMLARADPISLPGHMPTGRDGWNSYSGMTYLTLRPGADPAAIHAGMPAWKKRNYPLEPGQESAGSGRKALDEHDWRLVNVQDIHLGKAAGMTPNVERGLIATFAIVAALILVMACINFTNLATARASQRAREVALRKALGARRKQLVTQFLGESMLLAAIAMVLALAIVELLLPSLSRFLEADLSLQYFGTDGVLLPIVGLVLLVGIAGGLYPAFYLSRFQPSQVLKANASASEAPGSGRLRATLVVVQFAISIGLIICTTIVYGQTIYARTVDPGFEREGVLQVSGMDSLGQQGEAFTREVARVRGVSSVGRTMIGVSTGHIMKSVLNLPGMDKPLELESYPTDPGFFRTMGIPFLAGRTFDEKLAMDDATAPFPPDPAINDALGRRGINVIVNERAAEQLGFKDPAAAIGKTFKANLVHSKEPGPATIIGVVKNSRFRTVREPVAATVFRFDRSNLPYLAVRYEAADPVRVRTAIESVWKRFAPETPFDAKFTEEVVQSLYEKEEARGQIFAAFALVAVLVSSLGLFGLAAFTAERRTKEIGIRKVLGAKVRDIVRLLAWQFSKPVILANLVAWPVAWWVMRDWLNSFDDRIALTPSPFLFAGLLALAIAIGTIAGHAVKVARQNPILALRYE